MILDQLSVFIENKEGRMETVTKILKDNGINIQTLSLADTSEYGMLRLIVSDSELAKDVLKNAGFPVRLTKVLAIQSSDHIGYLHDLLSAMASDSMNIEYMYTLPTQHDPIIIMKVSDPEKIEIILKEKKIIVD